MTVFFALLGGLAAGLLGIALAWRRLVATVAARKFDRWLAEGDRRAVRRAVDASRSQIKGDLGVELSPLLPELPFEPADIRFLGHPAHFVVFAGHTAVKDRLEAELSEVVLVTLGVPNADSRLLDECIAAGRVRFSTLRIADHPPHAESAACLPCRRPGGRRPGG